MVADVDSLNALVRIADTGTACTVLPLSAVPAGGPPARRLVPALTRYAAVVRTDDARDAVTAVRDGIVEVVEGLVAGGGWPGIRAR